MRAETIFLLLLVLACPLMMLLMHGRGGHGSRTGSQQTNAPGGTTGAGLDGGGAGDDYVSAPSIEELKRRLDELERSIREGEAAEREARPR